MEIPPTVLRLVNEGEYDLSRKVLTRMAELAISEEDLLRSIRDGQRTRSKRDEKGEARMKYSIIGPSLSGRMVYTCGKIMEDEHGQEYYYVFTIRWADQGPPTEVPGVWTRSDDGA